MKGCIVMTKVLNMILTAVLYCTAQKNHYDWTVTPVIDPNDIPIEVLCRSYRDKGCDKCPASKRCSMLLTLKY
jgi:hypothetical protein